MTSADLTPYWPATEDWAGFLLVIVPVGPAAVPPDELARRVREEIELDAVLYDLVTVRVAAPLEDGDGWDRALVAGVVEAAMPDRHFFAPRGVIGVVLVGGDRDTLGQAFEDVRALPPARRWWARTLGAPASTAKIVEAVDKLVQMYDEQPQVALAEAEFLRLAGALDEEGSVSLAALEPPSARPAERVAPPPATTIVPSQRPAPPPAAEPVPESEAEPEREREPEAAPRLLEPVMYNGTEIVTVDQRTPIQRLRGQHESDADTMDELGRDGRGVALAQLVFVPDDGVVPKPIAKSRNATALELDRLLASVRGDTATGRAAQAAVEVLAATNPVAKHGVLRAAGAMTESALPKVKIEYFSVAEMVAPLLDAVGRTERALHARGVEVVSKHFVFLAAMRFPGDETTEDDWMLLLDEARVTWIDFGPPDGPDDPYRMPPSPFGLHVLSGKEDVLAVVREQSAVLYRYARVRTAEVAVPEAAEEPEGETATRSWWRFRGRTRRA